jgi:hypothetical protein
MNWRLGLVAKDEISGSGLALDVGRGSVTVKGAGVDEIYDLVATGLSAGKLHPTSTNIEYKSTSSSKGRKDRPSLF